MPGAGNGAPYPTSRARRPARKPHTRAGGLADRATVGSWLDTSRSHAAPALDRTQPWSSLIGRQARSRRGQVAQVQQTTKAGQTDGELRCRWSSADGCSAIARTGGDEYRVAGLEEGLFTELAPGRHVPAVQDQGSRITATLQPILDRVPIDGDHVRAGRLAHRADSARCGL